MSTPKPPRGSGPLALILAALSLLLLAGPAAAHEEKHPYESVIGGIVPPQAGAGIEVRMLDYDAQVELVNRSGRVVTVIGYEGEPYARLESGGPVYLNVRSPSLAPSNDRFGRTPPSGREDAKAKPEWTRVGSDGRLAWFDQRSHYRKEGLPPGVEDPETRTLIREYRIPLRIGNAPARIEGSLYWVGEQGFPTGILVALLIATGLCALFGAWAIKRMREPEAGDTGTEETGAGEPGLGEWADEPKAQREM